MSLECYKSCRWAHSTDWGHKSVSFTTVVKITCGLGFNCKLYFLYSDVLTWIERINHLISRVGDFNKISLVGWASIFTPESFEVDSTMITLPTFEPKERVNFNVWPSLLRIIILITTSLSTIILLTVDKSWCIKDIIVRVVKSDGY